MIKLHHPENEIELALLRSLLESADIPHYVHNDHFGTLHIGPPIPLLNRKTVMVAPEHLEEARSLLADYFMHASPAGEMPRQRYSLFDKLRMCLEFLTFGWLIPGNRWTRRRKIKSKANKRVYP
ncbi:MAG: hypothetical protein C0624_08180 [Desulfuromonas sp.]|nr:MAG: hypothetical protein C0624_08180 [Desulfuromonas sp.]